MTLIANKLGQGDAGSCAADLGEAMGGTWRTRIARSEALHEQKHRKPTVVAHEEAKADGGGSGLGKP